MKNKRAHTIPLTPLALSQLRYPRDGHPWVFGNLGAKGFNGYHWGEQALNSRVLTEPRWTLHDARRTLASEMARLGVRLEVIEKCLNHQSGTFAGVAGVYQRYEFAAEKRAAYDLWAAELARITGATPQAPEPPAPISPSVLEALARVVG